MTAPDENPRPDLADANDAAVMVVRDALRVLEPLGLGDRQDVAEAVTVAVLRTLSEVMERDDTDDGWPDSGDLWLMAERIAADPNGPVLEVEEAEDSHE